MPLREIINTTVECKLDEKLKEDIVSSQVFGNVNNKFDSLQNQMNEFKQDFATLRKEMEELKKLTNTVSIENKDIAEKLEGLNANVNSRVALSACGASYTSISPKTTVTFSNIITSEGITNQYLTSFKSSGVFVCEVPGLYHISVVIMSPANGAYLKIYKNNNKLIRLYIDSYYDDGHRQEYHSNAAIVVTELQKDDTIDIKPGGNKDIYIHHTYSCLTILKVK
ncbi:COL8A [Mytilus coruscus]|uniref:COL8A n=1 Tax=Mytilus coruscus TaxID=42192 RepID=A0A6J8D114_MYTCO|nr:COL8A [Mytilus coruscus]